MAESAETQTLGSVECFQAIRSAKQPADLGEEGHRLAAGAQESAHVPLSGFELGSPRPKASQKVKNSKPF